MTSELVDVDGVSYLGLLTNKAQCDDLLRSKGKTGKENGALCCGHKIDLAMLHNASMLECGMAMCGLGATWKKVSAHSQSRPISWGWLCMLAPVLRALAGLGCWHAARCHGLPLLNHGLVDLRTTKNAVKALKKCIDTWISPIAALAQLGVALADLSKPWVSAPRAWTLDLCRWSASFGNEKCCFAYASTARPEALGPAPSAASGAEAPAEGRSASLASPPDPSGRRPARVASSWPIPSFRSLG